MAKTVTPLSCGGKGPCCHIGYAHRHCEHCDVVISLVTFTWPNYWPTQRPYQPYQPWWGITGTGTQIGNHTSLYAMNAAYAGAANPTVPDLSEHACIEVIP